MPPDPHERPPGLAQDRFWDLWNPEDARAIADGRLIDHLRVERARRDQPPATDQEHQHR